MPRQKRLEPRISQELLKSLLDHLETRIPDLPVGIPLTLKQISSPEYWKPISRGNRRSLGELFSWLVDEGELPLEKFLWEHEYPLKYVRKF